MRCNIVVDIGILPEGMNRKICYDSNRLNILQMPLAFGVGDDLSRENMGADDNVRVKRVNMLDQFFRQNLIGKPSDMGC